MQLVLRDLKARIARLERLACEMGLQRGAEDLLLFRSNRPANAVLPVRSGRFTAAFRSRRSRTGRQAGRHAGAGPNSRPPPAELRPPEAGAPGT
jgi:hypothetical protein